MLHVLHLTCSQASLAGTRAIDSRAPGVLAALWITQPTPITPTERAQMSGTVVSVGAGTARCALNGSVVPDYTPAGVADSGGRLLILLSVSCVHKVR